MRRDFRRLACLAAAGALVLVATGCPDSDTIDSGNFPLSYKTEAIDDEGYSCVIMDITEIVIYPNDGTCSNSGGPCFDDGDCLPDGVCEGNLSRDSVPGTGLESLGQGGIQWANFSDQGQPCEALEGQFESGGDFTFQDYSEGLYRITVLVVGRPGLAGDNGDVDICDTASGVNIAEDGIFFSLGRDQPNTVRMVIDARKLAPLLEDVDCAPNFDSADDYARFLTIQTTQ